MFFVLFFVWIFNSILDWFISRRTFKRFRDFIPRRIFIYWIYFAGLSSQRLLIFPADLLGGLLPSGLSLLSPRLIAWPNLWKCSELCIEYGLNWIQHKDFLAASTFLDFNFIDFQILLNEKLFELDFLNCPDYWLGLLISWIFPLSLQKRCTYR